MLLEHNAEISQYFIHFTLISHKIFYLHSFSFSNLSPSINYVFLVHSKVTFFAACILQSWSEKKWKQWNQRLQASVVCGSPCQPSKLWDGCCAAYTEDWNLNATFLSAALGLQCCAALRGIRPCVLPYRVRTACQDLCLESGAAPWLVWQFRFVILLFRHFE